MSPTRLTVRLYFNPDLEPKLQSSRRGLKKQQILRPIKETFLIPIRKDLRTYIILEKTPSSWSYYHWKADQLVVALASTLII